MQNIGFMQGRLSDMVDGKIQAFPEKNWAEEYKEAQMLGIKLMEWTLDQNNLYFNPLMNSIGRSKIKELEKYYDLKVASVTGDCFMQEPFWKSSKKLQASLVQDFLEICSACSQAGIQLIVMPLVDNGSLENKKQEDTLLGILEEEIDNLLSLNLRISFESDFPPEKLSNFIDRFPFELFGINYDIGNSASQGFNPEEEFLEYGERITNVHIKDRKLNGTTVPLGTGNANFPKVFSLLKALNYKGNYILQTARDTKGEHAIALNRYLKMTQGWLEE